MTFNNDICLFITCNMVTGHAPLRICGSNSCDGTKSAKLHEPIACRLADVSNTPDWVINFTCYLAGPTPLSFGCNGNLVQYGYLLNNRNSNSSNRERLLVLHAYEFFKMR